MKIVYIAHPIGGDVESNLSDLRRIIRKINLSHNDIVPFCPYYADVVSLNDDNPEERVRGIKNDVAILNRKGAIDEMWLTGNKLSHGMNHEKLICEENGIPVFNYINHF